MPKEFAFPKKHRLTQKKVIDSTFKKGKFKSLGLFNAKYVKQDYGYSRFVISVSKRVGSSPERNRIKRLIREALRLSEQIQKNSVDCGFFITRPPQKKPTLSEIQKSIDQFFRFLSR